MNYYAQLDAENLCVGVTQTEATASAENFVEVDGKTELASKMLPLAEYDTGLIGKSYIDGAWVVVEKPETEIETETVV